MMMSMRFFAYIALFCLILLSACSNRYESENLGIYQENSSRRNIADGVWYVTQSFISNGGPAEYNIHIPYIKLNNERAEFAINEAIHELIIAPASLSEFRPGVGMLEIDYGIMHVNNELMSIHFSGFSGGWWGTNDIQKTITVDLQNGNILTLGDFFTYEEMEEIILIAMISDRAALTDSTFNQEPARSQYLNYLKAHFSEQLHNGQLLLSAHNFYIKDGVVGLIGLPFPSIRHHAIVEIDVGQIPRVTP